MKNEKGMEVGKMYKVSYTRGKTYTFDEVEVAELLEMHPKIYWFKLKCGREVMLRKTQIHDITPIV